MYWVIYWDTERREWCASTKFDNLEWALRADREIGKWKNVRESFVVEKARNQQ